MLYSKQHNLCLYRGSISELDRLEYVLQGVKRLNFENIAVPCTLYNMYSLRQLGYEALSPILNEYDWPCMPGRKPLEHQKHMAAFMTLHSRCFNLSDMGTMKTLATLWAADYLMYQGILQKVLIMSPLSTMGVWEREIYQNFLSRRRATVLHGTRERRLNRLQSEVDFYLINHDGLGVGSRRGPKGLELGELAQTIKDDPAFSLVIVDEGTYFKEVGAERTKVLRKVAENKPYVWWLTGTPVPGCPTQAYSQARIVRKDYTESFVSFRERVMNKVSTFKYIPRPDGYETAAGILQPAIRYAREDCLELPEVIIEDRGVELTQTQKKAIEELKKTLKATISGNQINAVNEAALRTKLLQIACGAVYGPQHEVSRVDCAPRIAALKEIIEQAGHKILIFASLTSVVNMLFSELIKEYSVERVTGDVSPGTRNNIFRLFQEETSPQIIVADPGTMAHGLTLTAAATTIWYGPTDKPEIYQQANKRMDRPGQRNRMLIVRIAATSVERAIYKRLDQSSSLQGVMLDLIKGE